MDCSSLLTFAVYNSWWPWGEGVSWGELVVCGGHHGNGPAHCVLVWVGILCWREVETGLCGRSYGQLRKLFWRSDSSGFHHILCKTYDIDIQYTLKWRYCDVVDSVVTSCTGVINSGAASYCKVFIVTTLPFQCPYREIFCINMEIWSVCKCENQKTKLCESCIKVENFSGFPIL